MASSSPATIPITVAPAPPGSGQPSSAPITTPAFTLLLSRLSDSIRHSLAQRRPWSELIDRSVLSRPDSLSQAISRARKNLAYFRVNYLALVALVLALSLLSNPISLLVLLSLLAAWCFLYLFRPSDSPLVILGRTFSDLETLVGLVVLSILVVFLTSVGSIIITAVMVGAALVFAHGAFRVPEDLFLDDQETGSASSGLMSFIGSATSSAAAVAARV